MKIEGTYKIKIWKDGDMYLARCKFKDGVFITQGRTEQEIFEMIADAFMTHFEIPVK